MLAVTLSVSSYVFHPCRLWKTLFPWRHLTPLTLTIFVCPLPDRSLNLERRTLIMTSHVGMSSPESLACCILFSCGSVLIAIYYEKMIL